MESTDLKKTTDVIHQIDFCILFLYKKRDVANIVKSTVCNRLFPAIKSDH